MQVLVKNVPFAFKQKELDYNDFVKLILEKIADDTVEIENFEAEIDESLMKHPLKKEVDNLLLKRFGGK